MTGLILKMVVPYLITFLVSYFLAFLILRRKYTRGAKEKTRDSIGVMDKILIIELIAIVIYIAVNFWIFYRVGAEPSTLTMSFFAVCGGENGFMAWIKTRKEQERFRRWQKEDEGKDFNEDKNL